MGPKRSLKARALQYLAQREQSRLELRRKLLPHALAEAAEAESVRHGEAGADAADSSASAAERVEAALDWLAAHDYLSSERFVESRVHARAPRFGNLRIQHELKQHDLALTVNEAHALKETELARACAVRARKFQQPPSNASEQARQTRFLMGRGFSPEVIRRALRLAGTEGQEPNSCGG